MLALPSEHIGHSMDRLLDLCQVAHPENYRSCVFQEMANNGIDPCPIFSLPGFNLSFVGIDVLHCCDLGITQDLIGNVLWEYVKRPGLVAGTKVADMVGKLGTNLDTYYRDCKTPCRIDALSEDMIKQSKKGPKLRAKGAETKGILRFAVQCAIRMSEILGDAHSRTVAACACALMDFYVLLDHDEWLQDVASDVARRYCVLYSALGREAAKTDDRFWKSKPKLHMFQELVEYQTLDLGHPARYWTYMDESFVGEIAKLAMSRGGPRNAAAAAKKTLDRYRALLLA